MMGLIIAAALLVAASVAGANTIESPIYAIHNLYTIYDYGNLVIAAINRSALTYLGNGYWLLVLPNMDAVTFSSEFVDEIIGKYIGPRAFYLRLRITKTVDGYRTVKTINNLDASDAPNSMIMNAIMRMLNISRAREALVTFLEEKVIRIDVVTENGIDVEKIAEELSDIAMSHKVLLSRLWVLEYPHTLTLEISMRIWKRSLASLARENRSMESIYGLTFHVLRS
jgi:hypothetical protein